jgi:sedoheptulokinase
MLLAGLDIGTTTLSGLLLDSDSGEIRSVVTEPNPGARAAPAPGESLQDADEILRALRRMLQSFTRAHGKLGGVGVAAQMHGILYVDGDGRAVSPLYTWQDGRGARKRADGKTWAEVLGDAAGQRLGTGMGAVTHFYNANNGLVPDGTRRLCTIADYAAMRLAHAAEPVMDTTMAASLGCFDLRLLDFCRGALVGIGIDDALFPTVCRTYAALGEYAPGVPVFPGLGDNQASFLGAVSDVRASVLFNVGTGSQVSLFSGDCLELPGIDTRPFPFGGYIGVGAPLCGGRAYAALHEFFERTLRLFGGGAGGAAAAVTWDIMNAARPPGTARLTVDTRFSGTRDDPSIRGSVSGLGLETFTPEHLIAGVREGIAGELLDYLALFPEGLRRRATEMVGSGNAVRLNPGLQGVFEERLGMKMRIPVHREETAFGAALLAGCAGGAFADLRAAGRLVRYISS